MADENITEEILNSNKTAGRDVATTEGLIATYFALLFMAVVPIYIGSLRSVWYHAELKRKGETAQDSISSRDAMFYPIYASATLFGLYLFFKFVPKEYVNMCLSFLFFFICVAGLARIVSVVLDPLLHKLIGKYPEYKLVYTKKLADEEQPVELFCLEFTWSDIIILILCATVGIWHMITNNWLLNNAFGLAFSLNAIEMISLNSVKAGCILLSGLFVYDIFWVFGTDVMVTVAKSLEAPIKLMFPMDILEKGIFGTNFSMLGLGDIVIPGIFIALLCRFDHRNFPGKFKMYFHTCFVAYIVGLVATVACLHIYKAAQPALLYLVPTCLGFPLLLALLRGHISALFNFEDYPETPGEDKED